MTKLIIATNNQGKVREIKSIFTGIYDEVLSLKDAGISADVVEDGDTFAANAAKKAVEISRMVDCDVLADDSGLCVDGLSGAPGVYSARYSPEGTDASNRAALIEAVRALPVEGREARFMCAIAVARAGEVVLATEAASDEGMILLQERGQNGFGYDSLFYVPAYGCTYAELEPEQKNRTSHRARALHKAAELLRAGQ